MGTFSNTLIFSFLLAYHCPRFPLRLCALHIVYKAFGILQWVREILPSWIISSWRLKEVGVEMGVIVGLFTFSLFSPVHVTFDKHSTNTNRRVLCMEQYGYGRSGLGSDRELVKA